MVARTRSAGRLSGAVRIPIPAWALSTVLLIAAGCGGLFFSEPERQWYKPSGRYTTEEFKLDKAACTRSGKLDVDCMKARGWVSLSADTPPSVSPQPSGSGSPLPPAKR